MRALKNFKEYEKVYKFSVEQPEKFWEGIARNFVWKKKWKKVLSWNFTTPKINWFIGGKLNITENCLDRHLKSKGNQTAIIWEPNNPKEKAIKLSYRELHVKVCQFANVLKQNGAKKGDRICIYMPMVPELTVAMLACARIGAVHSVVFGGFSFQSLSDRINDSKCKLVVTADGGYRGEKIISLKSVVDEALLTCKSVKRVIVLQRTREEVLMKKNRDLFWDEELKKVSTKCKAESMDSEDKLFILYTSGSTGKPKGIVHTCAGYMVYTFYTFLNVFQYKRSQVYWCTADAGWITGHSYMIYGPLLAGATTLMFEGIPTFPDASRYWEIIEKHKVNIFYTSPTVIRSLQSYDLKFVKKNKLSSLKVLGTVGEPINEEAWEWYHKNVGKKKCEIVDTWWQTETGGFMISPIAGVTKTKPGFATLPLPGIQPAVLDEDGKELSGNEVEGSLCFKFPWPGMLRTIYGNHVRCREVYFKKFKNYYFTSDGCKRDKDGYYRITGRVDDVINVSGHLIGTAEIENVINKHESIVESAVVGFPHKIKGSGIYAYVVSTENASDPDKLLAEVNLKVRNFFGPIGKVDRIQVVAGLPKTRSGKIMRRILRKIVEGGNDFGDVSTLLDPSVVQEIARGFKK